jgi:hypothetical protein
LPQTTATISKSQADKAGAAARAYLVGTTTSLDPSWVTGIDAWRQTHAYPLALVTPGVRNWVGQECAGPLIVAQRLKRFDRILSKLHRFPSMRLAQMEDVAGCRAVLINPAEVTAVAQRIKRKWDVREVSDYREDGKPGTGYRGLHVIVERRGRLVEIQLRTAEQHYWAEVVERTSSSTGFALKDGEGPAELLEYLRLASDLTWQDETGRRRNQDQFARLVDLRDPVRRYFVEQRPPRRRQ